MADHAKRVVILGGGFGGVYTARHLQKLLTPDEVSIRLVNRENYWVYQPMLPEVISGSISHPASLFAHAACNARRRGDRPREEDHNREPGLSPPPYGIALQIGPAA